MLRVACCARDNCQGGRSRVRQQCARPLAPFVPAAFSAAAIDSIDPLRVLQPLSLKGNPCRADVVDAALLEYMPDSEVSGRRIRRRLRPSPIRRSSIPGSHVIPWPSRRLPLCAGPRKSNPSSTQRLRVQQLLRRVGPHRGLPRSRSITSWFIANGFITSKDRGGRCAGSRQEIPAPAAKQLALEPTASAISAPPKEEIQEVKRIEDPLAGDGWDSNSATAAAEAPSFALLTAAGFRCRRQQEDPTDRGGGARTRGRRLFRLDQDHPRSHSPRCSSPRHPPFGDNRAASATYLLIPRDPARDWPGRRAADGTGLNGTTRFRLPRNLRPPCSQKFLEPRLRHRPRRQGNEVTVVTIRARQDRTFAGVDGSEWRLYPIQASIRRPRAGPGGNQHRGGAGNSTVFRYRRYECDECPNGPAADTQNLAGCFGRTGGQGVQPSIPRKPGRSGWRVRSNCRRTSPESGNISAQTVERGPGFGARGDGSVRQWKYKPYTLNSEPVEIQTQITVNFKLP